MAILSRTRNPSRDAQKRLFLFVLFASDVERCVPHLRILPLSSLLSYHTLLILSFISQPRSIPRIIPSTYYLSIAKRAQYRTFVTVVKHYSAEAAMSFVCVGER
ncbi:hypothetical protein BT96DRAFT_574636 [Gymnopus androsaceus JB14]|uniref:Uncharacterized protein n=1 Tax=Gymnopus androsaceus JB14 TaxID=1447944 RepID=A0A6A4GIW0_9AGAR|nr:hypothetical protein BT96DRAFT_574636 [Gymnopus androsaceus JB14]